MRSILATRPTSVAGRERPAAGRAMVVDAGEAHLEGVERRAPRQRPGRPALPRQQLVEVPADAVGVTGPLPHEVVATVGAETHVPLGVVEPRGRQAGPPALLSMVHPALDRCHGLGTMDLRLVRAGTDRHPRARAA